MTSALSHAVEISARSAVTPSSLETPTYISVARAT